MCISLMAVTGHQSTHTSLSGGFVLNLILVLQSTRNVALERMKVHMSGYLYISKGQTQSLILLLPHLSPVREAGMCGSKRIILWAQSCRVIPITFLH